MIKNLNLQCQLLLVEQRDVRDKYQILSVAYGFTYQSVTGWTSPYPGFVPF